MLSQQCPAETARTPLCHSSIVVVMCLVQGQWMVVVVVVGIVVCCCPPRVVIPVTEYGRCPVMRCCPVMAARPCIVVQWPLVIVPRPSSVEVQCSIVVVTHQPEVVDW
jgi:hypothetical protein